MGGLLTGSRAGSISETVARLIAQKILTKNTKKMEIRNTKITSSGHASFLIEKNFTIYIDP